MGTSASFTTPTGGDWSNLKREITNRLGGDTAVTPDQIVARTLAAAGGFGAASASPAGRGAGGGGGSSGGGGPSDGGGTRTAGGRASVGRAIAGLGGFGAALRDVGLDAALESFGLGELKDRTAAEVIARIAEHLAEDLPGTQGELLITALREAIFEVAALEGDRSYQNLESSLQTFLARDGLEGLVETFLSRFVFNRVWFHIENHVQKKSVTAGDAQSLASAVEGAIKGHVRNLVEEQKAAGRFDRLDWFGAAGHRYGEDLAEELENRLRALNPPSC